MSDAMHPRPSTYFASPERDSVDVVMHLAEKVVQDPVLQIVLETVQGFILIVNEHRQVLAGNHLVLEALGIHSAADYVGMRPGEVLQCVNSRLGPNGCGTSEQCSKCGAVLTVLACQQRRETVEGECSLTMVENGELTSREFQVRCTPLEFGGHALSAVVMQDISAKKRRDVLERVFIHDLRNVLHGIMGYSELALSGDAELAARMILALSNQLNEEIDGQDYLLRGEEGNLAVCKNFVSVAEVLTRVETVFERHAVSYNKTLTQAPGLESAIIETDIRLLTRVLVNMVKNAFEAIKEGDTVRIGFEIRNGAPVFFVWDAVEIEKDVALQIFRRSFSTKDRTGRGLGTYSMKLLGERYLGGKIAFSSSRNGTEFSIRLPEEAYRPRKAMRAPEGSGGGSA